MPFFKDWSYIHLIELNQKFSEVRYHAGDIIYNIGQESEVFYVLKTGRIVIETIIEIEEYHKYPVVSVHSLIVARGTNHGRFARR